MYKKLWGWSFGVSCSSKMLKLVKDYDYLRWKATNSPHPSLSRVLPLNSPKAITCVRISPLHLTHQSPNSPLDASQSKGWFLLILPGGERNWEQNFFPINNNTLITHPKLWMWSESKHFTCSCLSGFMIKSFWFPNLVEFVSFKMYTINYTDTCR